MEVVGDMARALILRNNQVRLREEMDKLAVEVSTGFVKDAGQHLNGDILWHMAAIYQLAQEIKICLGRRRKANFNLFKAHRNQRFKHPHFACAIHWFYKRLIAIAQVNRTPDRGGINDLVWPASVWQVDSRICAVFLNVHLSHFNFLSF